MDQTYGKKQKIKQLLYVLLPILVTQFGMFSMNFFDTMMSGKFSPNDLAGVAIGSSIWVAIFTGLSGILMAVIPIVAQLIGGKKKNEVAFNVIQAVYLSILMGLAIILAGVFLLDPLLNVMSLEPIVEQISHDYLFALGFGVFPLFLYNVLRSFIDALGKTRVSMFITLSALPINVFFNYVLIFGKFGFPSFGGVGAGYATAITYWIILGIAIFIIAKQEPFASYHLFSKIYRLSFVKWKEILVIGVPIGLAIFFETSIFSAVTLLMSVFDTITIASYQAAINFASFMYMIPLSISMALTILVGYEVGAKRLNDAKEYSWIGVAMGVLMAFVSGVILLLFRQEIAGLYTTDNRVLELTAHFLLYAIFFQLSDAIQAPIQGALRGYKDVNVTFVMCLVSYWVIGLPLGYYLATYTDWGPYGYWIGLISGLAVGATSLASRLVSVQKRQKLQDSKA
ncbi:MATE family efflux transporter [Robertmurraya yapensis]|uniref:MATE family efflux transporter n=2 Tax=Bacillaceae TaxID=186817 RepID=A0ACC6SI10_9BACI|nr:MATE family efflux transporter [Bacillus yapensis]RTR31047.1 MATE family efflux transporter [Bacillus yapensis]TKS95476.1 MATE family efflux transporter [Bacillus yapensis]